MLENYHATSGRLEPAFTLEIQTLPEDADRLLDAVMTVHPLSYGRYQRNASVSAVGNGAGQRRLDHHTPQGWIHPRHGADLSDG